MIVDNEHANGTDIYVKDTVIAKPVHTKKSSMIYNTIFLGCSPLKLLKKNRGGS
jgi:hypothetical protein